MVNNVQTWDLFFIVKEAPDQCIYPMKQLVIVQTCEMIPTALEDGVKDHRTEPYDIFTKFKNM